MSELMLLKRKELLLAESRRKGGETLEIKTLGRQHEFVIKLTVMAIFITLLHLPYPLGKVCIIHKSALASTEHGNEGKV